MHAPVCCRSYLTTRMHTGVHTCVHTIWCPHLSAWSLSVFLSLFLFLGYKKKIENRDDWEANQNTQEVKNERFLIWTRQNKTRIFGKFCLRQSDERTNKYKTRNVVNTLLNVTFENRRLKSSHPRNDRVFPSVYHVWCFISIYIYMSVRCFVASKICRKFAFCFV